MHRKILFIFILALFVRVSFVLAESHYHFLSMPFYASDTESYDALAQNLLDGNGYSLNGMELSAARTPVYPLFLAAFYAFAGRNFLLIGLVQSLFGALSAVLVCGIGRRVFSAKVGCAAAIVFALMPSMIFWTSGYILTEPLFIFFSLAGLYSLVRVLTTAERRDALISAISGGAMMAAASLTRPVFFYFALLAFAFLASQYAKKVAVIGLLVFSSIISIWAVRNYTVFGEFIYTTTGGGWVLYEYHNPHTTAANGGLNPAWVPRSGEISSQAPPLERANDMPEIEADRLYLQTAKSFALLNPIREIKLSVNRFWNIWRPVPSTARSATSLVGYATYLPMILLALVGLYLCERRSAAHLLMLFLVYHFAFYLVVVAEIRFRYPLEPVLIIFAASAVPAVLSKLYKSETALKE